MHQSVGSLIDCRERAYVRILILNLANLKQITVIKKQSKNVDAIQLDIFKHNDAIGEQFANAIQEALPQHSHILTANSANELVKMYWETWVSIAAEDGIDTAIKFATNILQLL